MNYYDKNAKNFFKETVDVNMDNIYIKFGKYLHEKSHIADIGCGSGRDSKYFKNKGYIITSTELSKELSILAGKYINQEVIREDVLDMDRKGEFDAVWACASLLHIDKVNILKALENIYNSLKENGIFYASLKYGDGEIEKDGRVFYNYTNETLKALFSKTEFKIKEIWITNDSRKDREDEKWINVIAQK